MPYDENLTGLEDLDWARKVLAAGYRVSYSAEAEIVHIHEETPTRVFNRYRREAIAMKAIFPEERFSLSDFLKLFVSNSLSDLYHAFHHRVLLKKCCEIVQFRFMQFWGTYQGYGQQGPVSAQLKDRFYYPNLMKRPSDSANADTDVRKIDYSTM
jgi:GT2 family glycosyltransferase